MYVIHQGIYSYNKLTTMQTMHLISLEDITSSMLCKHIKNIDIHNGTSFLLTL